VPELPEVETIRRYLEPRLNGRRIARHDHSSYRLRWPVSRTLPKELTGQTIKSCSGAPNTCCSAAIRHSHPASRHDRPLTVIPSGTPIIKHDHLDLLLDNHKCLPLSMTRDASVRCSGPPKTRSGIRF